MEFVKKLAIILLLFFLFLTILVVGFIAPIGLIIVGIICHELIYIFGGAIWLMTVVALWVNTADEMEEKLKEEFKL